jgi:hypothetical protein
MPTRAEQQSRATSNHVAGIAACVCALIAITLSAYWPGLSGPLLLDDYSQLKFMSEDPLLVDGTWRSYVVSTSGPLGRSVAMLSFLFNAVINGVDYWYWKLTNLVIHSSTGVVIFLLAGRLLRQSSRRLSAHWWAVLVTALWLLHPLQVSTVLYTVQRMSQLAAFFVFLGLLSYMEGRARQICGACGGAWAIGFALLVCFPLAVLSKENGALFPLFALLIEVAIFGFVGTVRQRRVLAAGFTVLTVLPGLFALLLHLDGRLLVGYEFRHFTLEERLLTECRVVVNYLYQLLVPLPGTMGFYYDDFRVSAGLFSPASTAGALAVLSTLVLISAALWKGNRLLCVGLLFFLLGHALEATILPLELVFEHRNYLPSFGVFIALAALLREHTSGGVLVAGACVTVLLISVALFARVEVWSSAEVLHPNLHSLRPGSWRGAVVLSEHLRARGRYPEAAGVVEKFSGVEVQVQQAVIACTANQALSDTALLNMVVKPGSLLNSTVVDAVIAIGRFGLDRTCRYSIPAYLTLLDRVLAGSFADRFARHKLLVYKGRFLALAGAHSAALETLDVATGVWEKDPYTYLLAAEWSLDLDDRARTREYLARYDALPGSSRLPYREMLIWLRATLAKRDNE